MEGFCRGLGSHHRALSGAAVTDDRHGTRCTEPNWKEGHAARIARGETCHIRAPARAVDEHQPNTIRVASSRAKEIAVGVTARNCAEMSEEPQTNCVGVSA